MTLKTLVLLLTERAPLREPRPTASRLAQNHVARRASHDCLRVAEHRGAAKGRQGGWQCKNVAGVSVRRGKGLQERQATYMLKQSGHFTSMKNEFGVCTNRFSLCRLASTEGSGCSRSISYGDWVGCTQQTKVSRGATSSAGRTPQRAVVPDSDRGAAPRSEVVCSHRWR